MVGDMVVGGGGVFLLLLLFKKGVGARTPAQVKETK